MTTDMAVSVSYQNGKLGFGNKGLFPLGYRPENGISFEEWERDGRIIEAFNKFRSFAMGDWLLEGKRLFPEMYAQAIDEFHWGDYNKLSKLAWVAANVPPANRRQDLTWSHHHAVASLREEDQRDWLQWAAENEMPVSELQAALKKARGIEDKGTDTEDDSDEGDQPMDGGAALLGDPVMATEADLYGEDATNDPAGKGETLEEWEKDAWDDTDEEDEEDEFPVLRVSITEDYRAAAKLLKKTFGEEWCLSLVENIMALVTVERDF